MAAVAMAKLLLLAITSYACMESSRTGVKAYDVCYKHQKAYITTEGPMLSTVRNMLKIF